jgi:hypothetical protein
VRPDAGVVYHDASTFHRFALASGSRAASVGGRPVAAARLRHRSPIDSHPDRLTLIRPVKRSLLVTLPVGVSLVGCGPEPMAGIDPCDRQAWDTQACEQAVANRGTFNGGVWIPYLYARPFAYYAAQQAAFARGGGRSTALPPGYFTQGWRSTSQRLDAMRTSPTLAGYVLRPTTPDGFRSRAFTYGAPGRSYARSGGFGRTGRAYTGGGRGAGG